MRRSRTKIIQIAGVRGLLVTLLCVACLFAGFVIFPAKVLAYIWNYFSNAYGVIPEINLFQGVLLWAIVFLIGYLANNKKRLISCFEPFELNEAEMKMLMERVKIQNKARQISSMILKSDEMKSIMENNAKIKNEQEIPTVDDKNLDK